MKTKSLLCLLCLQLVMPALAQTKFKWYNPQNAEHTVICGNTWTKELANTYHRLPTTHKDAVPHAVWNNSLSSAGLYICFRSNSPEIKVRYTVSKGHSMAHMPATGKTGVDLYATDINGKQHWCAARYQFKDTITYHYNHLSYNNGKDIGYEFQLFLPTYNEVRWMEIGVNESSKFSFIPASIERPIVVYGTSIAQGACATRPGMAWTNIVLRRLQHPIVNLGFSGSGMMEPEVFKLLSEIDAKLFIIDCQPNLVDNEAKWIYERATNGVKILREKTDAPILLVEHSGYTNEGSSSYAKQRYANSNNELRKAFEALQKEGLKNIYYLTHKEIGLCQDAMVEGVHPNDLGMQQYADAYIKKISEIFNEDWTTQSIFTPLTQQRDPYNWKERHEEILRLNRSEAPEILIIGNSITHYWAGNPKAHICRGEESWNKLFKNHIVRNLGFGYDRIENALWRIYHGELDGYQAKRIILMLGTNNLSTNTNAEIIEGLQSLIKAIRSRQPEAKIYMAGIMPRRNFEERIAELNQELQAIILSKTDATFIDTSKLLVDKNGRIKEHLFTDGLHPNADGYKQVAKMLKKIFD